MPEVHGSRKRLDPRNIPEKQPQPIIWLEVDRKPRLGQGRAGVRRKVLPSSYPRPGTSKSRPIIIKEEADPLSPKPMLEISRSEILSPYHVPQSRSPPKPPDQLPKDRK